MQMGAEDEDQNEYSDIDSDVMASFEQDIALQMGYTDVFKHVTLPTIEQLESETLSLRLPTVEKETFVKEEAANKKVKKEENKPGDNPGDEGE